MLWGSGLLHPVPIIRKLLAALEFPMDVVVEGVPSCFGKARCDDVWSIPEQRRRGLMAISASSLSSYTASPSD